MVKPFGAWWIERSGIQSIMKFRDYADQRIIAEHRCGFKRAGAQNPAQKLFPAAGVFSLSERMQSAAQFSGRVRAGETEQCAVPEFAQFTPVSSGIGWHPVMRSCFECNRLSVEFGGPPRENTGTGKFKQTLSAFFHMPEIPFVRDEECIAAAEDAFVPVAEDEARIAGVRGELFSGEEQPHSAVEHQTNRFHERELFRSKHGNCAGQRIIGAANGDEPVAELLKHQGSGGTFEFGTVFDRTEINIDPEFRVPFPGNLAEGGIDMRFVCFAKSGSDRKEIKVVVETDGSVFAEDPAFSAAVPSAEIDPCKPAQVERGNVAADALKSFAQERFRLRVR